LAFFPMCVGGLWQVLRAAEFLPQRRAATGRRAQTVRVLGWLPSRLPFHHRTQGRGALAPLYMGAGS